MNPACGVRPLEAHEVQLWILRLQQELDPLFIAVLPAEEQTRAARFRLLRDRQRFMIAHALTRFVLAAHLDTRPQDLVFGVGPFGKPSIRGSGLEFNLSRSGDFALLAVAWDRPVGVDLELVQPLRELDMIAEQRFLEAEVNQLSSAGERRLQLFFELWTHHEALLKASGMGLNQYGAFQEEMWSCRNLNIIQGYGAAVAARGSDWFITAQYG